MTDHFKGQSAKEHLHEVKHQHEEPHGDDPTSPLSACFESSKETAVLLPILYVALLPFGLSKTQLFWPLLFFLRISLLEDSPPDST